MPVLKKITKADYKRISESYNRKTKEYEARGLDELLALKESKTVKGTYLVALDRMIDIKTKIKNTEV